MPEPEVPVDAADDTPATPMTVPTTAPAVAPITVDSALANAARLLQNAEMDTNLLLMERLEHLADSWIAIARTLTERD
jgi:hypothetical protein